MILTLALPDVNVKDIVKWGITQVVCLGQTPGTLKNFATGSLNGGLWSIIVELQLYVVTVFIYNWVKKSKLNSLLTIIIFATFNLLCLFTYAIFYKANIIKIFFTIWAVVYDWYGYVYL